MRSAFVTGIGFGLAFKGCTPKQPEKQVSAASTESEDSECDGLKEKMDEQNGVRKGLTLKLATAVKAVKQRRVNLTSALTLTPPSAVYSNVSSEFIKLLKDALARDLRAQREAEEQLLQSDEAYWKLETEWHVCRAQGVTTVHDYFVEAKRLTREAGLRHQINRMHSVTAYSMCPKENGIPQLEWSYPGGHGFTSTKIKYHEDPAAALTADEKDFDIVVVDLDLSGKTYAYLIDHTVSRMTLMRERLRLLAAVLKLKTKELKINKYFGAVAEHAAFGEHVSERMKKVKLPAVIAATAHVRRRILKLMAKRGPTATDSIYAAIVQLLEAPCQFDFAMFYDNDRSKTAVVLDSTTPLPWHAHPSRQVKMFEYLIYKYVAQVKMMVKYNEVLLHTLRNRMLEHAKLYAKAETSTSTDSV